MDSYLDHLHLSGVEKVCIIGIHIVSSLVDIDPVQCAVCSVRQGVPRSANIFICFSCKSANFVQRDSNGVTRPFSPSPTATGRSVTLRRVTDTFYRVDSGDPEAGPKEPDSPGANEREEPAPHVPEEVTDPPILSPRQEPVAPVDSDPGQCTICMDEPADTVLRPCNHGGIGYKCADALVRRSLLTGGACCPQCRTQISSLIKLSEMSDQVAKGFEIEIPKAFVMRRRVSSSTSS